MPPAITMRRGAIALIDVLGFKGIWRRHSEEAVVRSLLALWEASQDDARQATAGRENMIDFIAPVFLGDGETAGSMCDAFAHPPWLLAACSRAGWLLRPGSPRTSRKAAGKHLLFGVASSKEQSAASRPAALRRGARTSGHRKSRCPCW
jgi:hypothetical protein